MLTNIRLLTEACQKLNIRYEILHPNSNIVKVGLKEDYFFVNYSTPLLSQSMAQIIKDKEYTYQLLKDTIKQPQTRGFLYPLVEDKYKQYLNETSIDAIEAEILDSFSLPVIVKKNRGSSGRNVFCCRDKETVRSALETIFNPNDRAWDYVAIAQEYINIQKEYRAICLDGDLILLYEKNIDRAEFSGNLSPLHWQGAEAKYVGDRNLMAAVEQFLQPIFGVLPIKYAGFDVALDKKGTFWLIEINSHPNYSIFIRDNDEQLAVEVFEKILISLMEY